MAEAKPNEVNARAKAVEALVDGRPVTIVPPIAHWGRAMERILGMPYSFAMNALMATSEMVMRTVFSIGSSIPSRLNPNFYPRIVRV